MKVFTKFSFVWIYLRLHEIRAYKTADYIGCMSPLGVEYILSKNPFLEKSKVEICPNCIRPNYELESVGTRDIRSVYNIPHNTCVFIFSGNLGLGHGLGFLIEAIKSLESYSKAFFVIGGSGTHFRYLQESFKEYTSNNVLVYKWLPPEDFVQILRTSDVGLILLDKNYTVPQFPSRLLSYLDAGKPVLCAVNRNTDIGLIVENSGSGRCITHGYLEEFVSAIEFFAENKGERITMGENARKLLIENYTTKIGYEIIARHFNNNICNSS